jgi:hypothetical protein
MEEWLVKTQAMAANGRYVCGAVNTVRRCWPYNTRTMWSVFLIRPMKSKHFYHIK